MAVSSVSAVTSQLDTQKSFRQADFLKIMLKEVTSQSPFDPQDTSKLVENMTKLQTLATAQYDKYRNDLRWAQDLVGKSVTAGQFNGTPAEVEKLQGQGLRVDPGYGTAKGEVTGFRVYDETVYLSVGNFDYPVDNIQQVNPADPHADQAAHLAETAARLLGMQVSWLPQAGDAPGQVNQGVVSQVGLGTKGEVMLTIGNKDIPFNDVVRIGMPTK